MVAAEVWWRLVVAAKVWWWLVVAAKNLHDRVLKGEARTSNGIESWHNQLASSVQAAHPTIWKLLGDLKNEMVLAEQKFDRFHVTDELSHRNNAYQCRDTNYKNRSPLWRSQ
jgi:hypothetical protein